MTLTLIGGSVGEPIREQIEAIIRSENISDKVKLIDQIDFGQLHTFLEGFQVFIHPSRYAADRDCEGGAPVVLLDAQATGMPVIATTHCDIPDEVLHQKTGLLTAEQNAEALAESIRYFYRMEQNEYNSFADNARRHIELEFDIRRNAGALGEIYRAVINK